MSDCGESWKPGDLIEVSQQQFETMPDYWFEGFVLKEKPLEKNSVLMEYVGQYVLGDIHVGMLTDKPKKTATEAAETSFDEVLQSIAQPVCLEDNIEPASPQWKKFLKGEVAKMFDDTKVGPHKHGFKDDYTLLYWNAHCQHWQKQKPPPLSQCAQTHGKGPFVRGYHAPVPYSGSTGTGIGYWHADKKKWLLWEPDPLPKEEPEKSSPAGSWVKAKVPEDWKKQK